MEKIIIQITAGRGPIECCRVVARVQEKMLLQARKNGLAIEVLENKKADLNGTLLSATLLVKGPALEPFVKEWQGTVQWIGQSPFRKFHRRKNWFVGVEVFDGQPLPTTKQKALPETTGGKGHCLADQPVDRAAAGAMAGT